MWIVDDDGDKINNNYPKYYGKKVVLIDNVKYIGEGEDPENHPAMKIYSEILSKFKRKRKMNWISVNDKKPNLYEKVLTYHKYGTYSHGPDEKYRVLIYTDKATGLPGFNSLDLNYEFPDVEYYLPLPNPPMEEKLTGERIDG